MENIPQIKDFMVSCDGRICKTWPTKRIQVPEKKTHEQKPHMDVNRDGYLYIAIYIYPVWLGSISSPILPIYPSQPGFWSLLPFLKLTVHT